MPHMPTPTYNIHLTHTNPTHVHAHSFSISLGCSVELGELCPFQGYDSVSRPCCCKPEVPHQLWPPPCKGMQGEFQICILASGRGCGVIFFPSVCQITHLPKPRDHFSKQKCRWGWWFSLKSHRVLRNAMCVTVEGLSPRVVSTAEERHRPSVWAGSFLGSSFLVQWFSNLTGFYNRNPWSSGYSYYYWAPTLRDYNSIGWGVMSRNLLFK